MAIEKKSCACAARVATQIHTDGPVRIRNIVYCMRIRNIGACVSNCTNAHALPLSCCLALTLCTELVII